MAEEVAFVFSVVCAETEERLCRFVNDDLLDRFKAAMGDIIKKLDDNARDVDPNLLRLKGLDAYAGPLEAGQIPGELTTGTRYGRIIFTGMATGKDIFTKSIKAFQNEIDALPQGTQRDDKIKEAHTTMKRWEIKFNYLLHEIFSSKIGGESYVEYDEGELDKFHPDNYDYDNPPTELPWNAAWTIFVVPEGTEFQVMGGHNC